MRYLLLTFLLNVFLLTVNPGAYCQNIGIYCGINKPNLSDFRKVALDGAGSYSDRGTWKVRAGINASKKFGKSYGVKAALGIEKFSTDLIITSAPQPETFTTDIQIDKTSLAIAVYPVCLHFLHHAEFDLGFEYSFLLKENNTGVYYLTSNLDDASIIDDRLVNMNNKLIPGIRTNLSYDISLGPKLSFSPEYSLYLGLKPEFSKEKNDLKAIKNYFGMQLTYKLGD